MAVTLTVNTDHTASLSSRYLARQGEVGALMTVTVPSAVYALGTYAYIDFIDADGVASYLGDYDASSGTFVVSVGSADNILAKDGIVKIQFVLRDNLISESYTAVWKSQIVEAIVERSVNADTYAIPTAMPSDDPPETYEASRVSIADTGTYFSSNNAEDALQEVGGRLADIESVNGIVKGDGAGTYAAATEADIPRAGGATYPFTAMPYVTTAPIIESGSGYVKYADGTMICFGTVTAALASATAMTTGGGYRTGAATFLFGQTFHANPTVVGTNTSPNAAMAVTVNYYISGDPLTTGYAQWRTVSSVGSAIERTATWIAIGRWKE